LLDGHGEAFDELVDRYYGLTLRVARMYVRSDAVAEEVAQDAWIGVIEGLKRFERRSTLKTWIMTIVANIARTRARREARLVPVSSLTGLEADGMDLGRYGAQGGPFPGNWTSFPAAWPPAPDESAAMKETMAVVRAAIEALPEMQRVVITLRDVEGWAAAETAAVLDLSEVNQRVLLHRARTNVRAALAKHFADE